MSKWIPYLCYSCRFFEYHYLDEDGLVSGGCCTTTAFPEQMRKKSCYKYQQLSKAENLKRAMDRLHHIYSIRFYHEGIYENKPLTMNQIWRLCSYIQEYLFHRDLKMGIET